MNRPWRVDDYIAQLPRYGKKNPWIGTTGAGQNCPERESESPGEDIIVDDWSSVRTLPFLVPKLTPGRLTITGSSLIHRVIEAFRVYVRVQFTRTVCQSVNEPRHPSVALLFRLSQKAQCFAKPCSVSRRETRQGNKQFRDLRRAPCRRQTCAVHRMGPAAPELGLFFLCLRKQNGCTQHEHLPNVPVSLPSLVSSLLVLQLLSEGALEKTANSWPTEKHGL